MISLAHKIIKRNPCTAISPAGKLKLYLVQLSIAVASFFLRKKEIPWVFEENPRTMKLKELLFFAYKYYVRNYYTGKPADFCKVSNKQIQVNDANDDADFIRINVAGDLMPYALINEQTCENLWKEKASFFEADIVVANLETPIYVEKEMNLVPELMLSNMDFNSSETQFKIFNGNAAKAQYDVLSFANNHSLDMGYEGAKKTHSFLERKNIAICGIGINGTHAMIERKGIKVAFLAYTFSLNQYEKDPNEDLKINVLPLNLPEGCDISPIVNEVEQVRTAGADIVVLMLHTGNAYQPYPGKQTQKLFKEISATIRVDAIIGGHPHNIQPLQIFENQGHKTFACYSLSDFIAYDIYDRCHLSLDLQLVIKGTSGKAKLTEVKVNANYMEYKNNQLILRDFDAMIANDEIGKDKKLLDLQWLYNSTILNPMHN